MMNTCPSCGLELFGYNETCPGCGAPLKNAPAEQPGEPIPAPAASTSRADSPPAAPRSATPPPLPGRTFADFLTLRWLVGPPLIRVIYWLGTLFGSFWTIAIPFEAANAAFSVQTELSRPGAHALPMVATSPLSTQYAVLMSVIAFILFNISWRLTCEAGLLLYKIHDHLADLAQSKRLR